MKEKDRNQPSLSDLPILWLHRRHCEIFGNHKKDDEGYVQIPIMFIHVPEYLS